MPLPILVGIGIGLLVGGAVVAFWKEIKQLAKDLGSSLLRTAKKSKNALKMIAKGFVEDDIFDAEFRLIKKGGKFIIETFVHEFKQTPSWKIWKNDSTELKTTHKSSEVISEDKVPSEVKETLKTQSEVRETLELVA